MTAPDPNTAGLRVVESPEETRAAINELRGDGRRLGLVPTMGALHGGHLSLIEAARGACDVVVVSIFVNPTQFGPGEDFASYPRRTEEDLARCRAAGVDVVFAPGSADLYPAGFSTFVEVEGLTDVLEGAHRPGHFRGVTTVVLKLLNVVQPDTAYFGLKDYQQQLVVRRMCGDLNVPVEIVSCPTVREPDGLALSSRNAYLSEEERERALALSRELRAVQSRLVAGAVDVGALRAEFQRSLESVAGLELDYATIVDGQTLEELDSPRPCMAALVAARVGGTRLIDNVVVSLPAGETTT